MILETIENAWTIVAGRKAAFRSKVVGQEARDLAKNARSRFKNGVLWESMDVTPTVRVGIPDPKGPRLGDRRETSCECDQKIGK